MPEEWARWDPWVAAPRAPRHARSCSHAGYPAAAAAASPYEGVNMSARTEPVRNILEGRSVQATVAGLLPTARHMA